MNLSQTILKILKDEPLFMNEIVKKINNIDPKIESGTIRQSVNRKKKAKSIQYIQKPYSLKKDYIYFLSGDKKKAYNKLSNIPTNLLNKYENRIQKVLISDFYNRIIDISTLRKVAGLYMESPNKKKIPDFSSYIRSLSNKYIEYEFRNIKFLIHRDYIFERDDEIQLTREGYAKANLIVDLLNEEIPYKKSFFDYVKKINLVGWDLLTCPEEKNRIVKFNGIPFDTYGMSYLDPLKTNNNTPRPILFDINLYRQYEDYDAYGFINRVETIKHNKGTFFNALGVVFCRSYTKIAQKILKNKGYLIFTLGNILGNEFSQLLKYTTPSKLTIKDVKPSEILHNSIKLASFALDKDNKHFQGIFNNMKGKLFEFITAYALSTDSSLIVEFFKANKRKLDIYVEDRNHQRMWIECKAYSKNQSSELYEEALKFLEKISEIRNEDKDNLPSDNINVKAIFICLNKAEEIVDLLENGKTSNPSVDKIFRPKKTKFYVWDGNDLLNYVKIEREKKHIKDSINMLRYLDY